MVFAFCEGQASLGIASVTLVLNPHLGAGLIQRARCFATNRRLSFASRDMPHLTLSAPPLGHAMALLCLAMYNVSGGAVTNSVLQNRAAEKVGHVGCQMHMPRALGQGQVSAILRVPACCCMCCTAFNLVHMALGSGGCGFASCLSCALRAGIMTSCVSGRQRCRRGLLPRPAHICLALLSGIHQNNLCKKVVLQKRRR